MDGGEANRGGYAPPHVFAKRDIYLNSLSANLYFVHMQMMSLHCAIVAWKQNKSINMREDICFK